MNNKLIKQAEERAKRTEWTRKLLKQFLYALHKSEGFGEQRLLRVLVEWSETYEVVNDPKNNANDEMLMIDDLLDKVIPSRFMSSIGYEKILDRKGNEIK